MAGETGLPAVLEDLPPASQPVTDETLPPAFTGDLTALESAIGHRFARPSLLRVALTLGSWANEHPEAGWPSNGCLEYFGDAVLDLVCADALWRKFPDLAEGELTRLRASLVSERSLAEAAERIDLGPWLFLGRGDLRRGAREHAGTLGDAYEAVVGAVFLDARASGDPALPAAAAMFDATLGSKLRSLHPEHGLDPKSRLQHWAQGQHRITPVYVRVGDPPPPDDPHWRARVELRHPDGRVEILGEGDGRSLRLAERAAASTALVTLGLEA